MEVAATIRVSFTNLTVIDGFTLEERKIVSQGGGGLTELKSTTYKTIQLFCKKKNGQGLLRSLLLTIFAWLDSTGRWVCWNQWMQHSAFAVVFVLQLHCFIFLHLAEPEVTLGWLPSPNIYLDMCSLTDTECLGMHWHITHAYTRTHTNIKTYVKK